MADSAIALRAASSTTPTSLKTSYRRYSRSLLRHPERFDPERGTLPTWLMTVTHHKAVDTVRWVHRRTWLDTSSEAIPEACIDSSPTPDESACLREARAEVRAALECLKPSEREVLLLAYFGGCTQTQIARRLGLPLGTIKSRTLSGLRHLRAALNAPAGAVPDRRAVGTLVSP